MALKYQYNKIALQSLNKQLNIRLSAVPTLKNKEAALRMEVIKAKDKVKELDKIISLRINTYTKAPGIWNEFIPKLIRLGEVKTKTMKIAGVKIPVLDEIHFIEEEYSQFKAPKWFPEGIAIVKELAEIVLERELFIRKMELLNFARRKTTKKVNLYEKVQIPGYEDAIRKIKRFLEDEENLSKSSQKIVKNRQQQQLEVKQ